MSGLNWGMIQDGGAFESLMHAILYAEDPGIILFGRPGKDAGQDARTADGTIVYQAKYSHNLHMADAVHLALEELNKIIDYRKAGHPNSRHWQNVRRWVLVANFSINPNDIDKWLSQVVPAFQNEGLTADYWHLEILEGKLAQHSEIRDVFFGGENRVLVGLKEAHDLLRAECVGSASLELSMVGREAEMSFVKAFAASADKQVLPIIGPGGIGKSRLLYESLVELSRSGWRVLWALPGTMSRSSQWFRLLNGSQQTCVALDDPEDPGLLRAVIEQLATVERRNWKVIIACRTEDSAVLRRFQTHSRVQSQLILGALDIHSSNALLNACTGGEAESSGLQMVYTLTNGIPGWICLIGELAKRSALSEFPKTADDVAAVYVDSCLHSLPSTKHEPGMTLLRWIALWGTLRWEPGTNTQQAELRFLENQGIPERVARDVLSELVERDLIRNWGVGRRLYAIRPLIIRQQILSRWLLRENDGHYEVSEAGKTLVAQLVSGDVPAIDSALKTLSHFAHSRLNEPEAVQFLGPVFSAMSSIARDGNLLNQYRIAELVEKAGTADPESALDVLVSIRKNVKEKMDVNASLWGPQSYTHQALVASLPWILFEIAGQVSDPSAARRFVVEFRELVLLEDEGCLDTGPGKGPRQLLKRLLCDSKNAAAYSRPAYDLAITGLTSPAGWSFVRLLAVCLLNPMRESMDWVANWTISIGRRALVPGTAEWDLAIELRKHFYDALKSNQHPVIRAGLWRVLSESHHEFHRLVMHGSVKGSAAAQYRAIVVEDLTTSASILQSPPLSISVEEATHAREMWSWYLEYGQDDDPIELARHCERIYNGLSKWRLHDFFRFDTDEGLTAETARIVNLLRDAPDPELFTEFFGEAQRYLHAARQGGRDMADSLRVVKIADACADLFILDANSPTNALTLFVKACLRQSSVDNQMAWCFVVRICQKHLLGIKNTGNEQVITAGLARLLDLTAAKDRLMLALYSNVHPLTTGVLSHPELECLLAYEKDLLPPQWFNLLGAFIGVDFALVHEQLRRRLDSLHDDPVEASECLERFIQSAYLTALRYDSPSAQLPVSWIIEMIQLYRLDGNLLGMHDLEWMRDRMDYRLSMTQFVDFMRSRIELDGRPKPSDNFRAMPYNYDIVAWCRFNMTEQAEMESFKLFCGLALGSGFTAVYWMPKYIAQIEPSGHHVAAFVESYLSSTPDIERAQLSRLAYVASGYPDDSEAWGNIARQICVRAEAFCREDREHIYFGLSRKETGVLTSTPGQPSSYFKLAYDRAVRLRDAEPLDSPVRGYREWIVRCAEADLRREEQSAEEDENG